MDREILFRGKRLDNGEWGYGAYGNHTSLDAMIIDRPYLTADNDLAALGFWEVDPATVGQYTGLTDKNGVKIFKGDIVQEKPCWRRGRIYSVSLLRLRIALHASITSANTTNAKLAEYLTATGNGAARKRRRSHAKT